MNLWQCEGKNEDGKRCDRTAVGVGGAIGLRAIGWYFRIAGPLLCPAHRQDGINGNGKYLDCRKKKCPQCKATQEADYWQDMIVDSLGKDAHQ